MSAVASHEGGLLLQFSQSEEEERIFHLHVRARDEEQPAWKRTQSLDVIHQFPRGSDENVFFPFAEAFVDALEALEGERGGSLALPEEKPVEGAPVRPPKDLPLPKEWVASVPSPFDWGDVFVVNPISDCGQSCSFCSVRAGVASTKTPEPALHKEYLADLARGREEGFQKVRFSGFDPLEYGDILSLIRSAKELGYEEAFVYSPGRAYQDVGFVRAILEALPPKRTLLIPLYGAEATFHDASVGRAGAFAEVSRGLSNLADAGALVDVVFMTVASREVAPHLPAIQSFVQSLGVDHLQVFQPWPASRHERDAFFEQALSHEEVLTFLMACRPPVGLAEILPCVRFRHEWMTGEKSLQEGGFRRNPSLMATLYEFDLYRKAADGEGPNQHTTPVVSCPHSGSCALAHLCPQEVYRSYSERFGLRELQPVGLWDLIPLFQSDGELDEF